jgi:hypothetical protein
MYREVRYSAGVPVAADFGGEYPSIVVNQATGAISTLKTGNTAVQVTGYTLQAAAANAATLTDGQTVFFGGTPAQAPSTTGGNQRLYIPRAGTIIAATVFGNFGTAGSNESWTANVRLNDTTNTLIQAVGVSASNRVWTNLGMAVSVAAGDFIEIGLVNPTWGTNPADGRFGAVIYIA